jgi:hypothetical protein
MDARLAERFRQAVPPVDFCSLRYVGSAPSTSPYVKMSSSPLRRQRTVVPC